MTTFRMLLARAKPHLCLVFRCEEVEGYELHVHRSWWRAPSYWLTHEDHRGPMRVGKDVFERLVLEKPPTFLQALQMVNEHTKASSPKGSS